MNWEFHTVESNGLCRVSVQPADYPMFEGTDDTDRKFWWRYPTGTKAITDPKEQQRIIRRCFGLGGEPSAD